MEVTLHFLNPKCLETICINEILLSPLAWYYLAKYPQISEKNQQGLIKTSNGVFGKFLLKNVITLSHFFFEFIWLIININIFNK